MLNDKVTKVKINAVAWLESVPGSGGRVSLSLVS